MSIYKLLRILAGLMAKEGYIATLQFVLHDIEEDEKWDLLHGHSERLAITFGLSNSKPVYPFACDETPSRLRGLAHQDQLHIKFCVKTIIT